MFSPLQFCWLHRSLFLNLILFILFIYIDALGGGFISLCFDMMGSLIRLGRYEVEGVFTLRSEPVGCPLS